MDCLCCTKCGWEGRVYELGYKNGSNIIATGCPKCGATGKDIEDHDSHPQEYANVIFGGGKFNWNKV